MKLSKYSSDVSEWMTLIANMSFPCVSVKLAIFIYRGMNLDQVLERQLLALQLSDFRPIEGYEIMQVLYENGTGLFDSLFFFFFNQKH